MQHALLTRQEHRLLRFALIARVAAVVLALSAGLLIAPFDTSGALALRPSRNGASSSDGPVGSVTSKGSLLHSLALPFTQWDTMHFLAIAREGYADEQQFAFLPGVPALLALAGRLPYALGLSQHRFSPSLAVLSVSLFAAGLSCLTPLVLYRLSLKLTRSNTFSYISSLLYILAPAPAILSVPYTEPFYAFFAFNGMLVIVSKPRSLLKASLCFAIAGSFRANGVLNIGFLAWYMIWRMRRPHAYESSKSLAQLLLLSAFLAAPFILQQAYGYKMFCTISAISPRLWCHHFVPSLYSFVQGHYWNVGFLRYWTLQQLPNFILAAPVLLLSVHASVSYYRQTWPSCFYRSLPFSGPHGTSNQTKVDAIQHPFFDIELLPFIHLHTILTLLLLFASHVQIALRQACTNPVIFWFAADLVQKGDKKAKWWTFYCIIWGAVSIVLWTLFYPPA